MLARGAVLICELYGNSLLFLIAEAVAVKLSCLFGRIGGESYSVVEVKRADSGGEIFDLVNAKGVALLDGVKVGVIEIRILVNDGGEISLLASVDGILVGKDEVTKSFAVGVLRL